MVLEAHTDAEVIASLFDAIGKIVAAHQGCRHDNNHNCPVTVVETSQIG